MNLKNLSKVNGCPKWIFAGLVFIFTHAFSKPGMVVNVWSKVDTGLSKELSQNWLKSIVHIRVENKSGNGLFISPKHVVTAYHVVEDVDPKKIQLITEVSPIRTPKIAGWNKTYSVNKILWKDEDLDVSVLEIKTPYSPYFTPLLSEIEATSFQNVLYGSYYVNGYLWISRECEWSNIVPTHKTFQMRRAKNNQIVSFEPGFIRFTICPGDHGTSGSIMVGLKDGKLYPMGVLSQGIVVQRRLDPKPKEGLTNNPNRPDEILPLPTLDYFGTDSALAPLFSVVMLHPIVKKYESQWASILSEAREFLQKKGNEP